MAGRCGAAVRRSLFGALAALVLSACSSDGSESARQAANTTTSTVKSAVTSSTVVPPPPPAPSTIAAPPVEVVSSADVRAVQERLAELGYDVGEPDGRFGGRTSYAIMAFQKIEGLEPHGRHRRRAPGGPRRRRPPGPMAGGPSTRVEIDLNRQVLILWSGGALHPHPADLQRQRRGVLRRRRVRHRRHPARLLPHRAQGRGARDRAPRASCGGRCTSTAASPSTGRRRCRPTRPPTGASASPCTPPPASTTRSDGVRR